LTGVAVQVVLQYADSLLRQKSEEKLKKGGSPIFHQDSKTIVADHQQLKSAIGAAATSFRARPIWSFVSLLTACLLESGATALIFARFYVSPPCRIQPASGFAGSNPSAASRNDSAPAVGRCQSQKGRD